LESGLTWGFVVRVVVKALLLFIALNVLYALLNPLALIGRLSVYNLLVPGRERLPYGESAASYNLSLNSLEAMFSSHTVSRPKADDEYRVLVFGDSSVWGILLRPEETLTGYLNAAALEVEGRRVVAYNLGHPVLSVTKDLMLMDYAVPRYQPDLIVWLVTLESLSYREQLEPGIVQNNAPRVRHLIERFDLNLDANDSRLIEPTFLERTVVGERRALADWWRLQMYGFAWANTGIDQVYPQYTPRSNDFEADMSWKQYDEPTEFTPNDLAFDVLRAGYTIAGEVPLLLVNEPIFIADGENSDLRYNFWYPRWAYDRYRALMSAESGWNYLDLWDSIAPSEFTDSPVHLTPQGSQALSEFVGQAILEQAED
jgi:hypothetical protein